MSAIKEWGYKMIYELSKEGYSEYEISQILDCNIEFVHAILGAD